MSKDFQKHYSGTWIKRGWEPLLFVTWCSGVKRYSPCDQKLMKWGAFVRRKLVSKQQSDKVGTVLSFDNFNQEKIYVEQTFLFLFNFHALYIKFAVKSVIHIPTFIDVLEKDSFRNKIKENKNEFIKNEANALEAWSSKSEKDRRVCLCVCV
jgi:hypothetical protein